MEMDALCYNSFISPRQVVRPANQLQLSEAELKEEHTRVLTANDPNGKRVIPWTDEVRRLQVPSVSLLVIEKD